MFVMNFEFYFLNRLSCVRRIDHEMFHGDVTFLSLTGDLYFKLVLEPSFTYYRRRETEEGDGRSTQ